MVNNGALSLLIIDYGLWNRFHVERARAHAATEVAVADTMTQESFRTRVDVRVKGTRHPDCFVIASKIRKEADQATTTYSRAGGNRHPLANSQSAYRLPSRDNLRQSDQWSSAPRAVLDWNARTLQTRRIARPALGNEEM